MAGPERDLGAIPALRIATEWLQPDVAFGAVVAIELVVVANQLDVRAPGLGGLDEGLPNVGGCYEVFSLHAGLLYLGP